MFDTMENKLYIKNHKIIRLLPNYFKWVGLVIMFLAGVLLIAIQSPKDTLSIITPRFFLLGLLLISLAKDKTEDEMSMLLRLKAMGFIFILVIGIIIIRPVSDLIWKDTTPEPSSLHIVLRMLIAYHVVFFFLKKFR